jgi:hydroxymethylglutaryl-CoA lyase
MVINNQISLVECPRDAMQGWPHFIPTHKKINYINTLLKVGFDTIDFGSFVSPKIIPQMADTTQVLQGLDIDSSNTKLLAIVANIRGAEEAVMYDAISYIGFPFSVSPTFQLRNTNSTIGASLETVETIQNLCIKNRKQLVIYISMGFGNPYGDKYNEDIVMQWVDKMTQLNIEIISMADTVGLARAEQVGSILKKLISAYTNTTIGVHLHSTPYNWKAKVDAALAAGCTRFDGALKGVGGCPMANDELVGNMDTELMIPYFNQLKLLNDLDLEGLNRSIKMAGDLFGPFSIQ